MAHGGWTSCGSDLCNGFHEACIKALVFVKEIGRKLGEYVWRYSTVRYCSINMCVSTGMQYACVSIVACMVVALGGAAAGLAR